jgi:hypothetical protein
MAMAQAGLAVGRSWSGLRPLSPGFCYIATSAALLGLWIGFYLASPFGFDDPLRDTWHHVAVLRELMAAPFAPSNPHIPTHEPSRYFTPLNILAALIGNLFHLSPYRLFGDMGAVNCIGLVVACWIFGRRYYRSPWAPLCLLLTLLFGWGAQMSHAGLHNYATFLSSAAYPSSIAFVLGIFSWGLALRLMEQGQNHLGGLIALGTLSAVILLTHQLAGVEVLAGTGSLILFHHRNDLRSKAWPLAAMTIGAVATLAWPYFSIVEVMQSASDPRWRSQIEVMNHLAILLILMVPALVGLVICRKPDGGLPWEWLLPAALFGLGFVLLMVTGSPVAHRLAPAIILYGQLALAWPILAQIEKAQRAPSVRAGLAIVGALVLGLALQSGTERLQDIPRRAAEGSLQTLAETIAARMPPTSVAFASDNIVFPLQSTGRRVVSIPRPEPVAPSLIQRQEATDRFFAVGTDNAERRRLITLWGATHVVLFDGDLDSRVVRELRALGPAQHFARGAEIITVDRSRHAEEFPR